MFKYSDFILSYFIITSIFCYLNFPVFQKFLHDYMNVSGCDLGQGWQGAGLLQRRYVHQVVGLPGETFPLYMYWLIIRQPPNWSSIYYYPYPDVRVREDDARPRPQREQRLLPAHRGLHRVQQQGQDHQDVGGADRLLRADIHGSQVTIIS